MILTKDRFDERGVETGQKEASEAPETKRAGNRWASSKRMRHTSTLHHRRLGRIRRRHSTPVIADPSGRARWEAAGPMVGSYDDSYRDTLNKNMLVSM